jgi:hypothetical protein
MANAATQARMHIQASRAKLRRQLIEQASAPRGGDGGRGDPSLDISRLVGFGLLAAAALLIAAGSLSA